MGVFWGVKSVKLKLVVKNQEYVAGVLEKRKTGTGSLQKYAV